MTAIDIQIQPAPKPDAAKIAKLLKDRGHIQKTRGELGVAHAGTLRKAGNALSQLHVPDTDRGEVTGVGLN